MKLDEYGPSDKIPNRPMTPPTDISGVKLKECKPYSMRLTPAACALMAEKARRTDEATRGERAPFVLHTSEGEKLRLKACLTCPDAEAASKAPICRTSHCNRTAYEDGLCSRCWHRLRA